jgi:hypothetical protein
MNFLNNINVVATGTIYPMQFVVFDTASDYGVLPASSPTAQPIIAVSQLGPKIAPGLQSAEFPGTTPNIQPAAYAGDEIGLFGVGDITLVQVSSAGTITPGLLLTADATGFAVAATSGNYVGGIAFSAANAGELVQCLVTSPGQKA